ncbi:hypothetical protein Lesp02_04520 [Lentzea sp. NBRC 105346]|uniref:DUF397 domain-containing protein n=1 Tax=Lentzea sp. NBRC 105346 TaxID=3032205 RepID=UPI0024A2AB14|nr:DUF397 domain-containing protein [Lentzea sp. NBRC 105346]GLZ28262.1 hypothetical protein Lesp02_04520 [Lentzea sp. NBRC 105346]
MWRKSSYCATGGDCVEVGRGVGIRDSKAPAVHIPVGAEAWTAFLDLVTGQAAARRAIGC